MMEAGYWVNIFPGKLKNNVSAPEYLFLIFFSKVRYITLKNMGWVCFNNIDISGFKPLQVLPTIKVPSLLITDVI